jgi:hypothetical protein
VWIFQDVQRGEEERGMKIYGLENAYLAVIVRDKDGNKWVCNSQVKLDVAVLSDAIITLDAYMNAKNGRKIKLFSQVAINSLEYMSLYKEPEKDVKRKGKK